MITLTNKKVKFVKKIKRRIFMKNYNKISVAEEARTELHDQLKLTGAEISINILPAGTTIPFVHSHKQNEEIYGVLEGKGSIVIDGKNVELKAGDWLKIAPSAKRQISVSKDCEMKYICIQVKENSLENYTMTDAIVY